MTVHTYTREAEMKHAELAFKHTQKDSKKYTS